MIHVAVRRGTTLIELVVVVALLAILAGVSAIALDAQRQPRQRTLADDIADSVGAVARDGRPRTLEVGGAFARVLPDGRAIADSEFRVERLTARSTNASR